LNSIQQKIGGIQQHSTRHSVRHSKRPFRTTFRKLIMGLTAENGIYTFLPQLSVAAMPPWWLRCVCYLHSVIVNIFNTTCTVDY
jgi:hypothetical protein